MPTLSNFQFSDEKPLPSTPPLNDPLPPQPKLFQSLTRLASSHDFPPLAPSRQPSQHVLPESYKNHLGVLIRQALRLRTMDSGWASLILEEVLRMPFGEWVDELTRSRKPEGAEGRKEGRRDEAAITTYLRSVPSYRPYTPPAPPSANSTTTAPSKPGRAPLFPPSPTSPEKPLPLSPTDSFSRPALGVTLWLEDLEEEGVIKKGVTWVDDCWAAPGRKEELAEGDEGINCDDDGVWRRWVCLSSGIDVSLPANRCRLLGGTFVVQGFRADPRAVDQLVEVLSEAIYSFGSQLLELAFFDAQRISLDPPAPVLSSLPETPPSSSSTPAIQVAIPSPSKPDQPSSPSLSPSPSSARKSSVSMWNPWKAGMKRLAKGVSGGGFGSAEEVEAQTGKTVGEGEEDTGLPELVPPTAASTPIGDGAETPKLLGEATFKDPLTGKVKSRKQQELEEIRLSTSPSVSFPLPHFVGVYAAIENGSRMTGAKGTCKVKASPALKSAVKEFTEGLQKPSAFIRHQSISLLQQTLPLEHLAVADAAPLSTTASPIPSPALSLHLTLSPDPASNLDASDSASVRSASSTVPRPPAPPHPPFELRSFSYARSDLTTTSESSASPPPSPSLGSFIQSLAADALTEKLCEVKGCGKPMAGEHLTSWLHDGVRVQLIARKVRDEEKEAEEDGDGVLVEKEGEDEKKGESDDVRIDSWVECTECQAKTEGVWMSHAATFLSLAKYLELLFHSRTFYPSDLCAHTLSASLEPCPPSGSPRPPSPVLRHFVCSGIQITVSVDSFEVWGINIGPVRAEAEGSDKAGEKAAREEKAMGGMREEVDLVYDALEGKIDELTKLILPVPDKEVELPSSPSKDSTSTLSTMLELEAISDRIRNDRQALLDLTAATLSNSLNRVRRELITFARASQDRLADFVKKHREEFKGLGDIKMKIESPPYLRDGPLHVLQGSSIVISESSPSSIFAHTLARTSNPTSLSTPDPSTQTSSISSSPSTAESFNLTLERKSASRFSTLTAGHASLRLPFVSSPKPTVASPGSLSRSSVSPSVQATLAPAAGDVKIDNPKERLLQTLESHQQKNSRLPLPGFDPPTPKASSLLTVRSPSTPALPLSTAFDASARTTAATSPSTPTHEGRPTSPDFRKSSLSSYEGLLASSTSSSSLSEFGQDASSLSPLPSTPQRRSPSPSSSAMTSPFQSSNAANLSSFLTSGVANSLSAIRSIRPPSFFLPEIDETSSSTSTAPPSSFSMSASGTSDSRKSTLKQPKPRSAHPLLQVETSISSLVEEGLHQNASYELDGLKIACRVYHAAAFELLRKKLGLEGILLDSLSRSAGWDVEGGKSNAGFFKTQDDRFVIKEAVSKMLGGSDLRSLMEITPNYLPYLDSPAGLHSSLAKIIGFFSLKIVNPSGVVTLKKDFLCLENIFFCRAASRKFDLKGIKTRTDDTDWITGTQKALLLVRPFSKAQLDRTLANDLQFLVDNHISDYSLLVGVDDERKELSVGILDAIGRFDSFKAIESTAKNFSQGENATVKRPDIYAARFKKAMDTYFIACPDKFSPFSSANFKPESHPSLSTSETKTLRIF